MKSFVFIVNPVSGNGNRQAAIKDIKQSFEGLDYTLRLTEYAKHATEIAHEYRDAPNTVVCAVGGDGSLNEIARGLVNSNTPMGLIPVGSGNGLARHLKIPLTVKGAIEVIKKDREIDIDTGYMNNEAFIVTCGVGFDAEVSYNFAQRSTRGLLGYVKESIMLFPTYKAKKYKVTANGISKEREAFSISVANASQYGNDAVIAYEASVTDGLIDLCIIKKYPKVFGPQIGISLFMSNLHNSRFYRGLQTEHILIESLNNETECHAQIDGESIIMQYPIEIKVSPGSLKVIVP
ncbi:MAG: diacylglycerol/lipid kinase family protein [Salibacteraceae bacterium]